jgi:spermidine synthase
MKTKLSLIVFLAGSIVMILELVGSRVVAPYLGTSTFVWTSLIGIVLAALSLGYHLGGRLADRGPSFETLATILVGAALCVGITAVGKEYVALIIQARVPDFRIGSVVASIVLFAPASVLLGMVSPYCIKLAMSDVEHAGATVGTLYAISTAGSIVGTFLAGFVLLSAWGTTVLLYGLTVMIAVIALIASARRAGVAAVVVFGVFGYLTWTHSSRVWSDSIDVDTEYQRVWIIDREVSGRSVRLLSTGPDIVQSGMYVDTQEPVSEYIINYESAISDLPNKESMLMIGGAGMVLARRLSERFPQSQTHMVEIDPGMTSIAKKFFALKDLPNLTIEHLDGRMFLNKSKSKFDVVVLDVFGGSISIPFQMITREAMLQAKAALSRKGVVIQNVVSALEGEASELAASLVKTYQSVFPVVKVYRMSANQESSDLQNLAVVASLEPVSVFDKRYSEWTPDASGKPIVLTDDYCPIEHYMLPIHRVMRSMMERRILDARAKAKPSV